IAFRGEEARYQCADVRIIVDDEHGAGVPTGDRRGRPWPVTVSYRLKWQTNGEARSASCVAFNLDRTTHHLAKPFGDCETETGAAIPPCRRTVGLAELAEQTTELLLGHADAGIGDGDMEPLASVIAPRAFCLQCYDAVLGKFARIAQKVQHDLPQSGRVGAHA